MKLVVHPSRLQGRVRIPGSKSHTIRAVAIAALASGRSVIRHPLLSADTRSALAAYAALGAGVEEREGSWIVQGTAGRLRAPASPVDVGNSGTTLYVAMGSCGLLREGTVTLDGDYQIRRRSAAPLISALGMLGVRVRCHQGNGCAPMDVSGAIAGGEAEVDAPTSQYVTSLLLASPLAPAARTVLRVTRLNEAPYVRMTLDWLARAGVRLEADESLLRFEVPGGQAYRNFEREIPADFSSATFFLAAGALPGNDVTSEGLDLADTQGDKAVVDYLRAMGAAVDAEAGGGLRSRSAGLAGRELSLKDTPDALPMMAALACLAEGTTRLVDVAHARLKETDRITVMAAELGRMGARITELHDGLEIQGGALRGAEVRSHDDHRVAMSLAVAATAASGPTTILGAECAGVTFPTFVASLRSLGARVEERAE